MTRSVSLLLAGWAAIVVAGSGGAGAVRAAGPQPSPAASPSAPRAILDQYCVPCHNQKLRTAGLLLDTLDVADVDAGAETWEKVIRKVRSGAMPPPGRPRPDRATADALVASLETSLDRAAAAHPNPGRTATVHRLNRAEYQNAIRDLLGLEIEVAALLPADEAGESGFDSMAGVLSISPARLARYMSAARKISRLVVGRPLDGPVVDTYRAPEFLVQDDRLSEELPFGSRGGLAIRHYFPVDGEYGIKVRLQTNALDYIRGMDAPHQIEIRLDGVRVKQFSVGGEAKSTPAPLSFAGYTLMSPEWETYMHMADAALEVRLPVKAGPRVVGVSFLREQWTPDGILQPQSNRSLNVNEQPDDNPGVDLVMISGPHAVSGAGDTPSRRQVFVCQPTRRADEAACAQTILARLARRAYRRPATTADVRTLLRFYQDGRREGRFDTGIQAALERLLVDPDFLFRVERDPAPIAPNTAYRLSDLELASRLSFFLWSSLPDEELLDVAARGTLKNPAVLDRQVRRLLADDRAATTFVENFAGQWLLLRNVKTVTPDLFTFPEFDDNLREAFEREAELFLESGLREDRSVVDLLAANYTFVNERLARHYGIPHVYGSRFRRVTLTSAQRGGLLGLGGLLTVTSYPTRTSPVLRGKWLLDNILGTPPPPPPPDVPGLPDRVEGEKPTSVRARLEQHRKNPVCAGCHAPMDPMGFALENFDAIGAWRTHEAEAPIDASGALPTGATFRGPAELRTVLLSQREQFVRTVTEKLLMYALGREAASYDQPVIRQIVREAAATDYRWSSIMLGIVKSSPFQMRRSAS